MPLSLINELDQALDLNTAPLTAFRQIIKQSQSLLADKFHRGEPVEHLVHARSDFMDQILQRAWRHHIQFDGACLAAVGGYGRGELHPASDIDVLILVAQEPDEQQAEQIERLIMFLWDIGLEIGHSVRTVSQCVQAAANDVTIITNLMESRYLIGERCLYDEMKEQTSPDHIWPSDQFFLAKCDEQKARHARYGDTAYNLEPNIKSNPGGLRDIQMIGWVVKRHFRAERLSELLHHGFLTDSEYHALKQGQSFLWQIRFALHLLTGRHEDRLLFEYQRSLAREFGYCDENANLAVEQFMQAYYRTVKELNRLNEMLLQFFKEAIVYQDQPSEIKPINRRFQAINRYIDVIDPALFVHRPLALLEIFLLMQENPWLEGVRARTMRLIRAHLHLIDDRFRQDIRSRSLFLEILKQPKGVYHALKRMHNYGVLAAYIPEFAHISGRMQFDLFHVFTVDEHTLILIRHLRRFSEAEHQHEFPLCHQVFQRLVKPELIYIAGLFHDIAKGRGGRHAELGAVDAHQFCKQHDLSDYDADMVAWIVRHHLLMSAIVQHQDIEDPEVVLQFANQVADRSRLDYLFLLTVADIRATNPERWTSWKYSMLSRLYHSARSLLFRGLEQAVDQDGLIQAKQNEAKRRLLERGYAEQDIIALWAKMEWDYFIQTDPDELVWHSELILSQPLLPKAAVRHSISRGCNEVFIIHQDQVGLFARCTRIICEAQLNILQARIQTTDDQLALNSFFVLDANGQILDENRARELIHALQNNLQNLDIQSLPVLPPLSRKLKQFHQDSRVQYQIKDQIIELRIQTMDRPGLLSFIAHILADQGLNLIQAKINTVGALTDDMFILKKNKGWTEEHMQKLVQHLQHKLDF